MSSLAVVGLQWGDEGKGKIVDVLSEFYDIVVRFQGGSNAGHTVISDGTIHKFRILPTGAVRGKTVVIGNGVVVDPAILLDEIRSLESNNIPVDLVLSDRAHIITPYHIQIDGLLEETKGSSRVGTTKRGIGPTYADKISRVGLRICDLLGASRQDAWSRFEKITRLRVEQLYGKSLARPPTEVFGLLSEMINQLSPYVADAGLFLTTALNSGKRVLFEGAQGTLLDIDHGTYPYVTSSNCVSGAAATGAGVPPTLIERVLGITKAYVTRVGSGPFPTELTDDTGRLIQEQGGEFGTVTGRPRRCGWLDLVALKYATRLNGAELLAVTKVDVLSGLESVKVATAYEIDGTEVSSLPASSTELSRATPIYEELPGWERLSPREWRRLDSAGLDEMPPNLREYLSLIEKITGSKVAVVSTGPDRSDTLLVPGVSNALIDA